jgi:UDP-N-acetylmuramoyl-L-alanyl-D-glutamate--2,6-diaminopimelate ligase
MGAVANSLADKIILTNDNPRLENPKKIIEEILDGIEDSSKTNVIEDRTKAIKYGLNILSEEKEESVLLLAGKGHESNQEIKRKTIQSNDYEIVRSFI